MSLQKEKIVARDRDHLRQIVFESIEKYGPNCDLNFIDVSQVTDMYCIFSGPNSVFNGDISGWDVSNVELMNDMPYSMETLAAGMSQKYKICRICSKTRRLMATLEIGTCQTLEPCRACSEILNLTETLVAGMYRPFSI